MRTILSAALITVMSISSAFADIKSDVKILGDLAMGYDVASANGTTAKDLFLDFVVSEFGLESSDVETKEFGAIDSTDEGVGFTSAKSAASFGGFAESFLEQEMENMDQDDVEVKEMKAQIYDLAKGWAPVIKRLEKAGATFAYSGYGPGYCGISFTQMHVIDALKKKVYTIRLSHGDAC
jgi:shikimate kinase